MLRRAATTIKLTPEDIVEYDEAVSAGLQGNSYLKEENLQEQEPDISISNYKDRNERMGVQTTQQHDQGAGL
ncbi:hypothetical protein PSN45_004642 [Yamadazyma tenuis]|uniref:Uncharacterized protein n=1 Tax=Candida tenuis (strain ATCC 10573 / BCRC 21748 / CBS 615 / JCM 9827 / NBRC 10315 / NRRL Y-1498 / VKM Y-70) TaxID=590646 RepID=G3B737_CANTC|nr:uncharacterized protein CANTEDRAFT_114400 [Yamadazyma tenuis ATCC 10573]EGV63090.1 hypothetical protein CANTEDRAFT_114400 [Yamadazyma tenuis ATCC 10573]WEJ97094.1 hypothetical protein PSN45_004642 [Yamadazyma tenuis]